MESAHDPLHLSEQTIATLHDANYWRACCPWLSCSRDSGAERAYLESDAISFSEPIDTGSHMTEFIESLKGKLVTQGFFRVSSQQFPVDTETIGGLARGAMRLLELGHSPSALLSYDETWTISTAINLLLSSVSGNTATGDFYTFVVCTGRHEFAGPHRDKPTAGGESPSFRPDGSPGFVTAWLALTEATPETSCIYVIPAIDDTGYLTIGDALAEALPRPSSWGNIVAQPCRAGDFLCFSHRIVHWGSRAQPGALPRIALSWALADSAFEKPIFDIKTFGPYPPLELRVALRAGQALAYLAQAPLTRAQLALDTRLFHAGSRFFCREWYDRVASAAQMELFRQKNTGAAKGMKMKC